jgi:hypothetical protein
MLTSILPVVDGDHVRVSRRLWLRLAALHCLGLMAAAAAAGGLLAAVAWGAGWHGSPLAPWGYVGAAAVALLYLPRQLGWTRWPPLVQSTRQVPRRWAVDYPPWATALLFGLGLGSGCYTRIVVPTFYLLLLWPFLTPGFLWPVLTWGSYGAARSLQLWWLAATAPAGDPFPHAHVLVLTLTRRGSWMSRANALVLLVVALWLVVRGPVS